MYDVTVKGCRMRWWAVAYVHASDGSIYWFFHRYIDIDIVSYRQLQYRKFRYMYTR